MLLLILHLGCADLIITQEETQQKLNLITNTLPTAVAVITPENPIRSSTLYCEVELNDDDGDPVTGSVEWLVDGVVVSNEASMSELFLKDQTVSCQVTPNAGIQNGALVETSVVIGNTPPEGQTISITPELAYNDSTISCFSSAEDIDPMFKIFK